MLDFIKEHQPVVLLAILIITALTLIFVITTLGVTKKSYMTNGQDAGYSLQIGSPIQDISGSNLAARATCIDLPGREYCGAPEGFLGSRGSGPEFWTVPQEDDDNLASHPATKAVAATAANPATAASPAASTAAVKAAAAVGAPVHPAVAAAAAANPATAASPAASTAAVQAAVAVGAPVHPAVAATAATAAAKTATASAAAKEYMRNSDAALQFASQ